MNVFVLDLDPRKAAQYHCDKHVVKMVLETAQILCTVQQRTRRDAQLYRPTHVNHPCVVWAAERQNYRWLYRLFLALLDEYTARYGKTHACQRLVLRLMPAALRTKPPMHFVQCMPEQYKSADAVTAYRNYYRAEKMAFAKWKLKEPDWL